MQERQNWCVGIVPLKAVSAHGMTFMGRLVLRICDVGLMDVLTSCSTNIVTPQQQSAVLQKSETRTIKHTTAAINNSLVARHGTGQFQPSAMSSVWNQVMHEHPAQLHGPMCTNPDVCKQHVSETRLVQHQKLSHRAWHPLLFPTPVLVVPSSPNTHKL